VRKISPPPGFDPRTVQPLGSCYTDCAIPDHTHTHTHTGRSGDRIPVGGDIFRTRPDRPCGPPSFLYNGYVYIYIYTYIYIYIYIYSIVYRNYSYSLFLLQYVLYITPFFIKCCKLMYIIIMFIIYNNTTNKMYTSLLKIVV